MLSFSGVYLYKVLMHLIDHLIELGGHWFS